LLQNLVSLHKNRTGAGDEHFTEQQWLELLDRHQNTCVCCNKHASETKEGKLTVDHVRPIAKRGSNAIDNIQPLCRSCNSKKGCRWIDYRPGSELTAPAAA
jgi:5-methylcytosine-specific restriction endonuclease McrA